MVFAALRSRVSGTVPDIRYVCTEGMHLDWRLYDVAAKRAPIFTEVVMRKAVVERATKETRVTAEVDLDGTGI